MGLGKGLHSTRARGPVASMCTDTYTRFTGTYSTYIRYEYKAPLCLQNVRVVYSLLFERSEFLIDTPHKKNLRVCPRARVK